MPKAKNWQWNHFHGGEMHNKAFKKAYCIYCVRFKQKEIMALDELAYREGRLAALRHQEEQFDDALSQTKSLSGRTKGMNNHLISCQFVPDSVKAMAVESKGIDSLNSNVSDGEDEEDLMQPNVSAKKHERSSSAASASSKKLQARAAKKQKTFQVIAVKAMQYTKDVQQQFENQLLKAFVSSGTAFNKIDDPEVQRLFAKFVPSAVLPTRQRLERQILNRVVVEVEGEMKTSVDGCFATLSCDGWKDISRRHLVAFTLTVNRQTHTLHVYDITSKRKTAANLLPIIEKECDYAENFLGAVLLGVCGDAAGDERKSRLDLVAKRPWYLAADCWPHQISLTLGDFIKRNPKVKVIIDEVVEVVRWFLNHSYALGVFNDEQQTMNEKILALIVPIVTRWTAYFLSMERLLDVWKPLQITAIRHEADLINSVGHKPKTKEKAKQIMQRVRNDSWWTQLLRIKTQIEPLAIAVNVAQAGNIRCDQILLLLGKLFKTYHDARIADRADPNDSSNDEHHELTSILDSIEKRWAKADQDLHVGAFFLNPCLNSRLLNPSVLSVAVLMGVLRRLYERLFRTSNIPANLMDSIYKYSTRTGIFSSSNWPVKDLEEGLKDGDMSCDPVKLWNTVDPENPLVQLATRVLSFCPSSASVERLFSSMGNIKTKKRNRMLPQKLRDIAFLQLELRQQQAKDGLVRQRLKRTLGNKETTSSPAQIEKLVPGNPDDVAVVEEFRNAREGDSDSDSSEDEHSNSPAPSSLSADLNKDKSAGSRSFASLVEGYESDNSDTEGENLQGDIGSDRPSMPRTVRVFFGQHRHIPIDKLFNWNVEEGWNKFWFDGVKNCRQEMEFYELVSTAEDVMAKESSGVLRATTDVGIGASPHQAIVINDT